MSNLSRRSFLRTGLAGGATLAVSTVSTAALAAKPAKGLYIPGTYSAKAAGIGDIVVTMTFDENRITDVVLNVAHETPSIGQAAAERLKTSLMAAQSAQIDVVSGASITSNAVMKPPASALRRPRVKSPLKSSPTAPMPMRIRAIGSARRLRLLKRASPRPIPPMCSLSAAARAVSLRSARLPKKAPR